MNIGNREGWRRLWVAANMIWVIGGIIVGTVFIIFEVYPRFTRYGYDMDTALMLLAVLAFIVLPPVGLRIVIHISQWIYEGFRDGSPAMPRVGSPAMPRDGSPTMPVGLIIAFLYIRQRIYKGFRVGSPAMSAGLPSQSSAAQIERDGNAEDYEAVGLEQTQNGDDIKGSSREIVGNTLFQYWLIELYERKRKYIYCLPLLFIILLGAALFTLTTLDYQYEPGSSESLRWLITMAMFIPVIALPVYVCIVYIYLGYSSFKRWLPKSKFAMAFLLPTIAVLVAATTILYEISGRFDFGLFVILAEHNALLDIFAKSVGRSGLPFAVIHLAIFSLSEKKRNPHSMANVLIGWPLVTLPIIGFLYV